MSSDTPDLSNLRRDRRETAPKRRLGWLLPVAIFVSFCLIFALIFRDRLLPAAEVIVTPVLAIPDLHEDELAEEVGNDPKSSTAGEMLFQASGWIEPDPLPILAPTLVDGVIDEVYALEGQLVKKGELLATLVDIDSRLRRDAVVKELEMKRATVEAHCVRAQILIQEMDIAKAELAAAEADFVQADDRLRRLQNVPKGAVTEDDLATAKVAQVRGSSLVSAKRSMMDKIGHEMNELAYETVAMQREIELSEIALAQAELALSRTRISAPVDGRVLRLLAAPGQKKMLISEDPYSATIAILYQPAHLQVRVDVPLADAAGLTVGQAAKIRCGLLPDQIFDGEVTRITGEADLQRNTLQAKVRIVAPDHRLRPEMLSRVEFFQSVSEVSPSSAAEHGQLALHVPKRAIRDGVLWVCDPKTNRVGSRQVTVAPAVDPAWSRVMGDLRPGEWVVVSESSLHNGQRVKAALKPSNEL